MMYNLAFFDFIWRDLLLFFDVSFFKYFFFDIAYFRLLHFPLVSDFSFFLPDSLGVLLDYFIYIWSFRPNWMVKEAYLTDVYFMDFPTRRKIDETASLRQLLSPVLTGRLIIKKPIVEPQEYVSVASGPLASVSAFLSRYFGGADDAEPKIKKEKIQ